MTQHPDSVRIRTLRLTAGLVSRMPARIIGNPSRQQHSSAPLQATSGMPMAHNFVLIGEVREGTEYFIAKIKWSERVERGRDAHMRHFGKPVRTLHSATEIVCTPEYANILHKILREREQQKRSSEPTFTKKWVETVLPTRIGEKGLTCHGPFLLDREERRNSIGGELMQTAFRRMGLTYSAPRSIKHPSLDS